MNTKVPEETQTVVKTDDAKKIPDISEIKSVFLHNFSNKEISLILRAINSLYPDKTERRKLVFAKTTESSLNMKVDEWVQDTAEDHLYLLENPPNVDGNNSISTKPSTTTSADSK